MSKETIKCPYCGSGNFKKWASERGFDVVRCECRFLYVNPRPSAELITDAVKTGVHSEDAGNLNAVTRRIPQKVRRYERLLSEEFRDLREAARPIYWLDVGAGFGEVVEAVTRILPEGSTVKGLEPMKPKADEAKRRGLNVEEDYLRPTHERVDLVSSFDVFSHIPDYHDFLRNVRAVLKPGGEVFIQTGNLADVEDRSQFPDELGLPDHLTFAGEAHLKGFLDAAGFDVVSIRREPLDTVLHSVKSVVKKAIGRETVVALPYTSAYRQIFIRGRLRG